MNDKPTPPHVFANRVIKQVVEHAFGEDLVIEYDDYQALRVAFRSCGGSWLAIGSGDVKQIELLGKVIAAWGQMPERKHTGDRVI